MTLYQDILMWVSLAAAFALAAAGVVVWCDLREVLPGRRILQAFLRLPWLVRLFLVAFVVQLVVHGSTKTNATNGVDGGTTNAPPIMTGVPAPGVGHARYGVVQPEPGRVPAGAVLAQKQWRRGCWEDWLSVSFEDGWVFPHGTNHLSRVAVMTQGELRTGVRDTDAVASLGAKVAHVPFDTCFYHELTPSNSYRFVWDRAYVDRNTNMPMYAAIELFRNGDKCVTTNGVAAFTPREIPYPHIGIGQNDDWVRTNFVNAADILAVGYREWVEAQVGVNQTNGLFMFTAAFAEDPPEATELTVGDLSVVVTNAGEYVFLLEKGVEYTFGTTPYDATVEYTMQDDVGPDAEIVYPAFSIFNSPFSILSWWWGGNALGEWTVDGGWHWITLPSPLVAVGWFAWMPEFHGSPDVTHLGVNNFPMTFEAVLEDCCHTNGVTYQWSTSTEGVHIVSPNCRTTEVTVDALPSWAEFSMTVKACLADEELTSTITTSYGTNATPQVSFSLSIPDVMFVNDDDDDDDGTVDCLHVTFDDDDIATGSLTFHSDVETNAVIKVESISGFEPGFYENVTDFVFTDWNCTTPIREGDQFAVIDGKDLTVPLYVNPICRSSHYEDVEIVASMTLEGGERRELTAKATVISPVLEPICCETVEVVNNGVTNMAVCNPCGVGIGEKGYYKIRVEPEGFPDAKIVWNAEGGLSFVGGNTGREVCVLGTAEGDATLKVRMRKGDADVLSMSVRVVPMTIVGIRAVIVSDGQSQAQTEPGVREMVKTASEIFSQIGISFVIDSIIVTNLPAAYVISETNVSEYVWSHSRLTGLLPSGDGIKCYFVSDIVGSDFISVGCRGMTSRSGVVITKAATPFTLAHEIGHLCDVWDVYVREGGFSLASDNASFSHMTEDWNGGCLGRGAPGARYYRNGFLMSDAVARMLMNGRSADNDLRRDMSAGDVFGVWYSEDPNGRRIYRKSDAPVGFRSGTGFRVPSCD